jgi:Zn-dependent peptidase ImmA (M78 family)
MEIEANQFAAEVLMPAVSLRAMLNKRGFDIDDDRPLEILASKFRVSRQALEFRIRSIRNSR